MPEKNPNPACLRGGCDAWACSHNHTAEFHAFCKRCGFNRGEDERRRKIPFTRSEDGLYRKVIPKLPAQPGTAPEAKHGS